MNKRRKGIVCVCGVGCVTEITNKTYVVSEKADSQNKCFYRNNIVNSFGYWKVYL